MFVKTIPFNLCAILTLYMPFTSIAGFDFGLMKKHSRTRMRPKVICSPPAGKSPRTRKQKDLTEGGKYAKGKVIDLIAAQVVMIATAIAAMI